MGWEEFIKSFRGDDIAYDYDENLFDEDALILS
jgi:hypothetical protein